MICPHCSTSIKYKERNNNICSQCHREFAFDPKTHSLKITDKYFSKVVEKLSDNGNFYITPQQLHFALSRKKMKSPGATVVLVIFAIVTSIICLAVYAPLIIFAIPFWIFVIIAQFIYFRKFTSLPQTFNDFYNSVIIHWKSVYKNYPKSLILEKPQSISSNYKLRGILFCQTTDTVDFLVANQLNVKHGLAIFTGVTPDFSKLPNDLPIYVLHDASGDGYAFLKKVKDHFVNQRQIIDLGLRPQSVMKSKLMKFRQTSYMNNNFDGLSQDEIKWLNQGYYTPLFVLRPAQLIQYLDRQIERRNKQSAADSPEKQAQAVGFMTWVGE